ncbi:MAG: metal ABC transporter permease [Planctomycetes bacterium]|nr:metal ABC transporter permease [Planctomycetota bacterium]
MNWLAEQFAALSPAVQATLWTVLIAMAAATSSALLGSYLVLRRMGLVGDAISHAVLPGLVVGFLMSGTRELWPMLLGAAIAGLAMTYLAEWLRRHAQVEAGGALGVVFTSFFALGVILINLYASQVDLDPGCVLYGALGTSALDTIRILGLDVPRSFLSLGAVALLDLAFVAVFWKELKISSFDPALATTLGISAIVMNYLLMGSVAVTVVAGFEAVGSILIIAMLIVPGATAHLFTDRLATMLVTAVLVGWIAAAGGCLLAVHFDTSEAGMISVVAGAEFALAALAAPRYGIAARILRGFAFAFRIVQEDVLARLYRLEEGVAVRDAGALAMHRPAAERLARIYLRARRQLTRAAGGWALTERGRARAQALVRSHRLWEGYLSEQLRLPLDHLHEAAHRMEHYMTPQFAEKVEERLVQRDADPHGRRIPPQPSP